MQSGHLNIVIGAQAGSESKGKMGAYLARKYKPGVICMAACPNSGHTVIMDGRKFVTYHLPVSWVGNRSALILLGPTSIIHLPTLMKEIAELEVPDYLLKIHPRAVMVRDYYLKNERDNGLLKIGSTNTGVGVARREKLMRVEDITLAGDVPELDKYIGDTVELINEALNYPTIAMLEMTQGFDLCLEHGIDRRYCTSKMIVPAMGMAEAGVSPSLVGEVYGVMRPYPIRVNNREGSSGPYAGSKELTWDEIAKRCGYPADLPPLLEITTTTKLPRRVFEFNWDRLRKFCMVCEPTHLCLQFANYLDWGVMGVTDAEELTQPVWKFIHKMEGMTEGAVPVSYVGTGPGMDEMVELGS